MDTSGKGLEGLPGLRPKLESPLVSRAKGMSEESNDRPFTAEELDESIGANEVAFRNYYRAAGYFFKSGRLADCDRCHTDAAEAASILAELRYQRERLS